MTKVEDLLRKSQTNAFQMNEEDLDKMYNLDMSNMNGKEADGFSEEMDDTSKNFYNKIKALRDKQKTLLPLFLQSKKIVDKHKKCLSTIV